MQFQVAFINSHCALQLHALDRRRWCDVKMLSAIPRENNSALNPPLYDFLRMVQFCVVCQIEVEACLFSTDRDIIYPQRKLQDEGISQYNFAQSPQGAFSIYTESNLLDFMASTITRPPVAQWANSFVSFPTFCKIIILLTKMCESKEPIQLFSIQSGIGKNRPLFVMKRFDEFPLGN